MCPNDEFFIMDTEKYKEFMNIEEFQVRSDDCMELF